MKEFMMAALPWICIGFAIALFAANHGAVKKAKDSGLLGLVVGKFIKKEKE